MEQPEHGQANPAAQLLVDNFALIRQLVRRIARRHRLTVAERQDFESWVWLRLVEGDFYILRRFAGRSSLTTYLRVVFSRCLIDFRTARWGKWRPSAAAQRLGSQAVALERLVTRDGMSREEAAARVGIDANVLQRSTRRSRPRTDEPLELAAAAAAPPGTGPEEALLALDRQAAAEALARALAQALGTLGEADYRLLWLRYGARLTVPKIAARLGEDQKSLYRKYLRLHATMRTLLEELGITRVQIASVVGAPDVWLQGLLEAPRPSTGSDRADQHRGLNPSAAGWPMASCL
jgi:RNA polymerase sigma factor for flagellar operon FliA